MTSTDPPTPPPSEPTVLECVEEVIPGVPSLSMLPRAGKTDMAFFASNGEPVIELKADGRILVEGRDVAHDVEVVDGLRRFLRNTREGALIGELRDILEAEPHETVVDAARRAMRR